MRINRTRNRLSRALLGVIVLFVMPVSAKADEASTSDLAKAAQNPLASMISLPFQNNTNTNFGPE